MVIELQGEQKKSLTSLFEGWEETMISSCLQGHMGRAFTNTEQMPQAGLLCVGDFYLLAGSPQEDLVCLIREIAGDTALVIPREENWSPLIQRIFPQAEETLRYAFRKTAQGFCVKELEKYALSLPEGFYIQPIHETLYHRCLEEEWSRDFVSLFQDEREYQKYGIGFVAMYQDELVAGASSYSYYDGGIEIEVDTKETYRQKGLASACAARLILECLKRGLYPSWDAANKISLALAKKLGYQFDREYVTYVWEDKKEE